MGLKRYIYNHIEMLIANFLYKKEAEKQHAYSFSATFSTGSVRIDNTAIIANNRGDRSFITIGDNSWLKGELLIWKNSGEIHVGRDCFIGDYTKIWSSDSVSIGDRVLVSHGVNIHDNVSHPLDSKERHMDFLHVRKIGLQDEVNINQAPITIGNDVWIGFNATILKGVTIGNGAIIGANTVITKDVPAFAVVVGNPPRIVKYAT